MASFRAQLSPNEETTLARIATGTDLGALREADVRRLVALGLVHAIDGNLTVSESGMDRCEETVRAAVLSPARDRRRKIRRLPF
jgi:hypothetical protein